MNELLLKSWAKAQVGDLCELINGRAFKPTEWETTGLPIIRIQNLNNENASFNYFNGEISEKHKVFNGDLLFAWSGTPGTSFGAHVWQGKNAALNQHIFKIQFDANSIDKSFFRYAINQKLEELIGNAQGGVGLRHVTKGTFEKTELAFPPLAEQQEIATRLDAFLAQVDVIKARLDATPAILKRFRQAVLAAAVSGELLQLDNPKIHWIKVSLCEIAQEFSYGTSAKSSKEGLVPVLRMGNIQGGVLIWDDLVYTSDKTEIKKYQLEKNDILFNRTNSPELVGKTAIYKGERNAIYAGYLIKIKCSSSLNPDFLNIHLNSPQGRNYCWEVKSDGVSQSNINAKKIAAYPMELPPLPEQTEIVNRVEQLFTFADQIEQQVQAAQTRVNQLTQSILAKAFKGELTADWRAANPELISGENSAEALLEKIKATQTPAKPKRGSLKLAI